MLGPVHALHVPRRPRALAATPGHRPCRSAARGLGLLTQTWPLPRRRELKRARASFVGQAFGWLEPATAWAVAVLFSLRNGARTSRKEEIYFGLIQRSSAVYQRQPLPPPDQSERGKTTMAPLIEEAQMDEALQSEAMPALARFADNAQLRDRSLGRFAGVDAPPYASSTEDEGEDENPPLGPEEEDQGSGADPPPGAGNENEDPPVGPEADAPEADAPEALSEIDSLEAMPSEADTLDAIPPHTPSPHPPSPSPYHFPAADAGHPLGAGLLASPPPDVPPAPESVPAGPSEPGGEQLLSPRQRRRRQRDANPSEPPRRSSRIAAMKKPLQPEQGAIAAPKRPRGRPRKNAARQ